MYKNQSNNSEVRAEQAASKAYQTIKLGLDIHADSIVVVRILENSAPQPAQRFKPERFLVWVKTQLAQAETVHSCYEAGPLGFVLHRQLSAMGVQNAVVHPICLDERRQNVNNDKRDARELAQRLDRYVAGNKAALPTVRVPTPEEEQRRIQSRQREQLRREVHRVGAQGRSLLLSQGYRQRGKWWQKRYWTRLSPSLPGWLVERLEVFRRMLETLEKELQTATAALEAQGPRRRPRGLGGLTHRTLEAEVCQWSRFDNRRQIASYTGLCGGVSASGQYHQLLSITKHGNVRLRTALIELAWRWVFWQPDCPLVRRWSAVLYAPKGTRAARKKAIVAIARQLAVDLWRWQTGRVTPEKLGWVMVEE